MGNLGPTGSKSEDDGPLELMHLFLLGHEQAKAESFVIFFTSDLEAKSAESCKMDLNMLRCVKGTVV